MTPEFYPFLYTIVGATVSLAGFMLALFIFFHNQMSKRFDAQDARMDRQDDRMDRLEAKFDQLSEKFDRLAEEVNDLKIRVARLEWMLDAALHGRPVTFPAAPPASLEQPNPAPKRKAPARRRVRRRRSTGAPYRAETAS